VPKTPGEKEQHGRTRSLLFEDFGFRPTIPSYETSTQQDIAPN
jgi:hypothetical protein